MDCQNRKLLFYVHGKGGSASEAEYYKTVFDGFEVYGFDYKAQNPWEARGEFQDKLKEFYGSYSEIILVAGSIGAYFTMNAGVGEYFKKAYFISPIVNLERLIVDMISWAGTSESELEQKKIIPVDFGEDLSWDYLQYVRNNRIAWNVPTEILYRSLDNLQSIETMNEFVSKSGANLTIMEGGEHWFHTDEQVSFLDNWIKNVSGK